MGVNVTNESREAEKIGAKRVSRAVLHVFYGTIVST